MSSPLARALETARSLVAGRAIPLEVAPVFAEGSLGRLAGLSLEAAARAFPDWMETPRTGASKMCLII